MQGKEIGTTKTPVIETIETIENIASKHVNISISNFFSG